MDEIESDDVGALPGFLIVLKIKILKMNKYNVIVNKNELWIEGKLKDKKAFICAGKDCYAGITCEYMDTYASDRKMIPHFIMSQQDNMHSESCEIYREFLKIDINRNKTKTLNVEKKQVKAYAFI